MSLTLLHTLIAYRTPTGWAFDDATRGLVAEPFVYGADTLIDETLAYQQQSGATKCRLTFGVRTFPQATVCLQKEESETLEGLAGTWYREVATRRRAWLCPALTLYFEVPPPTLYVQVLGL